MACVISVNLPDFHAKKSGKLDNPTNIDERHSDKQASRERPDPPDCLVCRIVFDQSLSDLPVCRIFFCVCRIVLFARLSFAGLSQKMSESQTGAGNQLSFRQFTEFSGGKVFRWNIFLGRGDNTGGTARFLTYYLLP